jgi:hypothetical protein
MAFGKKTFFQSIIFCLNNALIDLPPVRKGLCCKVILFTLPRFQCKVNIAEQ